MTLPETDLPAQSGCPTVAVVGDGQLARMMQPAAIALGVHLRVLATDPASSAAQVIPDVVLGGPSDAAAVREVTRDVAALTFEHEHVTADDVAAVRAAGISVQPSPEALRHASDKLYMRERLTALGHPCPQWRAAATVDEMDSARVAFGGHAVVKTIRGGYDGRGVQVVSKRADCAGLAEWCAKRPVLVEERVDFIRELAVLVARSPSGQAAAWPVVQTTQTDGICDEVVSPAPDLAPEAAAKIVSTALAVAADTGVTGMLAVEGFETHDGRFLINELAMRPHNSGHFSIEGSVTSQFEQHLRAVLDLPLGSTAATAPWTVMVNILGGPRAELFPANLHVMARDPGAKVHLYGKAVAPGRKVGHVTVCGDSLEDCRARARHAADYIMGRNEENA